MFLNVEELRYLRIVCGIWVLSVGAIPFAFGIMTNTMKEQFQLTQGQLTTVSTFGTVFGSFALPAGFVWDHYGPKPVLLASGIACAIGFAGMALSFAGTVSHSLALLCVWNVLMAMPASWMDIGSMMTNLFSFPYNTGDVVVLQKTFMGLGATIVSLYYTGWFHGGGQTEMVHYCAFIAVYVFIILMVAAAIMDLPSYVYAERRLLHASLPKKNSKDNEDVLEGELATLEADRKAELEKELTEDDKYLLTVPADPRRMKVGFGILFTMTLFLIISSLIIAITPNVSPMARSIIAGVTMLMTASFLVLPFMSSKYDDHPTCSSPLLGGRGSSGAAASKAASPSVGSTSVVVEKESEESKKDLSDVQYDYTFTESLRKPDLWLMWWANFCVWGSGSTIIANAAQIYRAINNNEFNPTTNAFFVASIGLGSAIGRIICGLLDQHLLQKRGLPTTWLFPIPATVGTIGVLLFLVMPAEGLVLPFAVYGAAFGWCWAATVLVSKRLFRRDLGKQYNWIFTAPMCSSIALNRGVFGTLYDKEARAQGRSIQCSGLACVEGSLAIMAALCATAAIAASILHWRWSRFLKNARN